VRVSFDRFVLDFDRRLLVADGTPVHLPPKAFALLEILVTSAPRALSKEDLCTAIWIDAVVEESNLAGLVADLRDALGDSSRNPRFIRTIHGFGYAFCCGVSQETKRARVATILFRGDPYPLHRGENILGRDPEADVEVDDSTVSRRHARIVIDESHTTLEDLGSKNGTFLYEEKISGPVPLRDGQTIVLGDARLVYRSSTMITSTVTISTARKK
jgi:DNA-binding winged helix-turn-helix (wHTH) protein